MTALRIAIVGPLAPPSGGMANQTCQLARLLRQEGIYVEVVQVNMPYWPAWTGRIPILRAPFRLVPYLLRLWRTAGRVQIFHVMANSGWSWHLFVAPAVWLGRFRGARVVINYRGGEAETFFAKSFFWVRPTLLAADQIVVPSDFLAEVFGKRNVATTIIPNIVNLSLFSPGDRSERSTVNAPRLVVTRNLEAIYDISTALRAFALLLSTFPDARLTVAGSGPERNALEALAREIGVAEAVSFTGRLDNADMAALYRSADMVINPSRVDNMPNSLLEALASGVPVVSTNVGGVPYIVQDGKSALLVPPGNPQAMAAAITKLLSEPALAQNLVRTGLLSVQRYAWPKVREQWLSAYQSLTNTAFPSSEKRVSP